MKIQNVIFFEKLKLLLIFVNDKNCKKWGFGVPPQNRLFQKVFILSKILLSQIILEIAFTSDLHVFITFLLIYKPGEAGNPF